jgi:hypothetical protein
MLYTVPLERRGDAWAWRREVGVVSRLFAFSTARRSYSSHICAVFPGVHGGGRGSLKGEIVRASGEECCGVNVMAADIFQRTTYSSQVRCVPRMAINEPGVSDREPSKCDR